MNQPSDEELVAGMRSGNADALSLLFDRYYRLVFDVARRVLRDHGEAEDLMQEVFIEVFRKANLYDPTRGSVRTWLLQYAYHRSFNRRKYLSLRSFYNASPAAALVDLELSSERAGRQNVTLQEWQEILRHGMGELSDKERKFIEAIAFDGLTVREAADRMRESYVNGRNHYYRALRKLRQFLGKKGAPAPGEVKDVQS